MNFDIDELNLSDIVDEKTEFIPLLSTEDEAKLNDSELPEELSILPIRNMVLFPGVVMPITIGRDKSIKLVKDANDGSKILGVVSQKDKNEEEPTTDNLFNIGTFAKIHRMIKMPDGSKTIIIQGKKRFQIEKFIATEPYIKAKVSKYDDDKSKPLDKDFEVLLVTIRELANSIIKVSPNIPNEASIALKNIESPTFLINFICSNLNAENGVKQELLELTDLHQRASRLIDLLTEELKRLQVNNDIQSKTKIDIDQQQREFFLNQQLRAIQEELGGSPSQKEIEEYTKRAKAKKWSKKTKEVFEKELAKLQRLNPMSAEYSVQTNYIDTFLDLPWKKYSTDNFDLKRAKEILNRDHHGLEKVKERIIEHLAVLKLRKDLKAPILCLVGPPGVGKTSLGKSIAESLDRKYVRMSLGGLHDEAEIRGHRKTYIGAMPGRILQNLKKAETSNPVFVLDEIDKLGKNMHGDPSSALLEVLDPEQNDTFSDNFIEVEYDLSKVMFIATANSLSTIQPALLDRMEIIEVSGYTLEEKNQIAQKHLVPKQLKEHGLSDGDLIFTPEILDAIIEGYTRESGVRKLDKTIAKIVRSKAVKIAMEEPFDKEIKRSELKEILGAERSKEKYDNNKYAGVVTGLAWTAVGGDILFIETNITKGKGNLSLTGNLGDVMKESATIAYEYIKANADYLGLKDFEFEKYNIHIHVPEGAVPKDGPSAGITMLTAISSALTQQKVKANIAMTGEITLRGKVLPVGGIKEKILAAKRAGIKEVILCTENRKDIEEIEKYYLEGLTFHFVDDAKQVLDLALTTEKVDDFKVF